ncbi:MAG: hypothetical protein M1818_005659 [Claussenomyces sp. TS43310]|nr:MAG: hypothetical protein M1818_005659 [Claussenomyces sp. TS43310]
MLSPSIYDVLFNDRSDTPTKNFDRSFRFLRNINETTLRTIYELRHSAQADTAVAFSKLLWDVTTSVGAPALKSGLVADLDQAVAFGALAIAYLDARDCQKLYMQHTFNWFLLLESRWLLSEDPIDCKDMASALLKYFSISSQLGFAWDVLMTKEQVEKRHNFVEKDVFRLFKRCERVLQVYIDATAERRETAYAHSQLGILYYSRGIKDLSKAAKQQLLSSSARSQERAISLLVPDDIDNKVKCYGSLAWSHSKLYWLEEKSENCVAAIQNFEFCIPLITDKLVWSRCTEELARLYWARGDKTSRLKDSEKATELFKAILEQFPNNPTVESGLAQLLSSIADKQVLSNAERRQRTDAILELLESVIVHTSDGDDGLPSRLGRCADALASRFAYDASIHDIDVAIELQLLATALPQCNGRWLHLKMMSSKLHIRYLKFFVDEDLAKARQAALDALACVVGGQDKARCLDQLAVIQVTNFQNNHKREDLDLAISNQREAIALRPNWRSSTLLQNLGKSLMLKFDITGSYGHASEGIKYLREAVDVLRRLVGKGNHAEEHGAVSALADALRDRFQWFQGKEDLSEAIRLYRDVVIATDEEHPVFITYTVDLVFALSEMFKVFKDKKALSEAESRTENARFSLESRPHTATQREKEKVENLLGIVRLRQHTGNGPALEHSICHFKHCFDSVFNSPIDEFWRAATENLAQAVRMKAEATGETRTIEEALQIYMRILSRYNNDKMKPSPSLLRSMAAVAHLVHRHPGTSEELRLTTGRLSRDLYGNFATSADGSSREKITPAIEAACLYYTMDKDLVNSKKFAVLAAKHLVDTLNLGLSRQDHLEIIKCHASVPSFALFFSMLDDGDPREALTLFERARGAVWGRTIVGNIHLDELERTHADLAAQFGQLRSQLSATREPLSSLDTVTGMAYNRRDHYQLATEYEEVLRLIQSCPGFESFPLWSSGETFFSECASEGPIAVVNISPIYSHVILIQKSGVTNITLNFYDQEAYDLHLQFKAAIAQMRSNLEEATKLFETVMLALWKGIAEPILTALNLDAEGNSKSTLRWVTTGWLNILPIHLAGDYQRHREDRSSCTVPDRVVSTYIPSVRALQYVQERRIEQSDMTQITTSAILVEMKQTPGYPTLPHASQELEKVSDFLSQAKIRVQHMKSPTTTAVVETLRTSSLVHFACHAIADSIDPTKSRILLSDHQRSAFDIRRIGQMTLSHCKIAYLSACETAQSQDVELKDECLHIANAFLMAGVPTVIATWWKVVDEESASIAESFYRYAFDASRDEVLRSPAMALHQAAAELRAKGVSPLIWGAYVCFGV